jgi:hypothetical protein
MTKYNPTIYIKKDSENITVGANLGFMAKLLTIYASLEAMEDVDGYQPKVTEIRSHIRIYSKHVTASFPFLVCPVIVQTAGNLVDNDNETVTTVAKAIDDNCDDVVGCYPFDPKVSKRLPTGNNSQPLEACGCEFTLVVPPHLIQLINKELETERLQELYTALVGVGTSAQTLVVHYYTVVKYVQVRKNIIIR